jgi:hypothetical protein
MLGSSVLCLCLSPLHHRLVLHLRLPPQVTARVLRRHVALRRQRLHEQRIALRVEAVLDQQLQQQVSVDATRDVVAQPRRPLWRQRVGARQRSDDGRGRRNGATASHWQRRRHRHRLCRCDQLHQLVVACRHEALRHKNAQQLVAVHTPVEIVLRPRQPLLHNATDIVRQPHPHTHTHTPRRRERRRHVKHVTQH